MFRIGILSSTTRVRIRLRWRPLSLWDQRVGSFRQAASYVDRILKGARPADLPIPQPVNFDLIGDLKTAMALGFSDRMSHLLRRALDRAASIHFLESASSRAEAPVTRSRRGATWSGFGWRADATYRGEHARPRAKNRRSDRANDRPLTTVIKSREIGLSFRRGGAGACHVPRRMPACRESLRTLGAKI